MQRYPGVSLLSSSTTMCATRILMLKASSNSRSRWHTTRLSPIESARLPSLSTWLASMRVSILTNFWKAKCTWKRSGLAPSRPRMISLVSRPSQKKEKARSLEAHFWWRYSSYAMRKTCLMKWSPTALRRWSRSKSTLSIFNRSLSKGCSLQKAQSTIHRWAKLQMVQIWRIETQAWP